MTTSLDCKLWVNFPPVIVFEKITDFLFPFFLLGGKKDCQAIVLEVFLCSFCSVVCSIRTVLRSYDHFLGLYIVGESVKPSIMRGREN